MEIQPTQIQFNDAATYLTYTASIQNGSYNIFLPNHQIYNVVGTWGGITFNATGIAMSGIDMGILNLNTGIGVTSITQNWSWLRNLKLKLECPLCNGELKKPTTQRHQQGYTHASHTALKSEKKNKVGE